MATYADGRGVRRRPNVGAVGVWPGTASQPVDSRRIVAVGVAKSTPRAALGIYLALGVDRATPTATLGVGHFLNLYNF
jgi:hypothetical protein